MSILSLFFWTIILLACIGGTAAIIYFELDPRGLIRFPTNNITLICPSENHSIPETCDTGVGGYYFKILENFTEPATQYTNNASLFRCDNFSDCSANRDHFDKYHTQVSENGTYVSDCPQYPNWPSYQMVSPLYYQLVAGLLYGVWILAVMVILLRSIKCAHMPKEDEEIKLGNVFHPAEIDESVSASEDD